MSKMTADQQATIERAVADILDAIGEDVHRPGLQETPRRVAQFWREFVDHEAGSMASFPEAMSDSDLVAVKGMDLWSLCEHHLLPFSVTVSVGYLPVGRVLGLSKFARIAQRHAHRLQVQERLTRAIADAIVDVTGSPDVAVVSRGSHTCMAMRGVRVPAVMHTSVMLGRFRTEAPLRAELLALIGQG